MNKFDVEFTSELIAASQELKMSFADSYDQKLEDSATLLKSQEVEKESDQPLNTESQFVLIEKEAISEIGQSITNVNSTEYKSPQIVDSYIQGSQN